MNIRVGLIGCGRWGRHILRDLRFLGCDVAVVASSPTSCGNAFEGGASRVVEHLDALPPVDGIVVATPTITHAAVIEAALRRGVPVFTEKPLTADSESATRLAHTAPDRLFVMDKWRYHPGIEMLGQIAREKELGPVLGMRTTRVQWGDPHDDVDCIWILAPHDLSIALEVFGCIPPVHSASAERVSGNPTSLIGTFGEEPWLVMEVSSRSPEYRREVRLHCRDGVAVLNDGYSKHLQIARTSSRGAPDIELRPISEELPLLRELRAFIEYLEGGPPPRSSAAEGALIVNTITELRVLAGITGKHAVYPQLRGQTS